MTEWKELVFTLAFITSVFVVEVLELGWVLFLREGYQYHERRAHGFPEYRLPLWARAYWTAILALLFLSLGEAARGRVPVAAGLFAGCFALGMALKIVIHFWFPGLRERLVTMSWTGIAILRGVVACVSLAVLVHTVR